MGIEVCEALNVLGPECDVLDSWHVGLACPRLKCQDVGVQWSSRMNSLYQLVSQVFPPSAEKACSHFATTWEPFGFSARSHGAATCAALGFSVRVRRTRMGFPLNVSEPRICLRYR